MSKLARVLTMAALCTTLSAASWAAGEVQITVNAGFDGHFKDGRWLPVTAVISNSGKTIDGLLQVRTEGPGRVTDFTLPVKVPAHSNRAYTLYVLGEGLRGNKIKVRLHGRGLRALEAEGMIRPHPQGDKLVVLVTRQATGIAGIAGMKVPQHGAELTIGPAGGGPGMGSWNPNMGPASDGLPLDTCNVGLAHINTSQTGAGVGAGLPTHPKGYDSVDVVVLHDASPAQFSEDEVAALKQWVAAGGTLVVSVGADVPNIRGTFVEDLLPVTLTGTTTLSSMPELAWRYSTPMPDAGEFVVATAKVDRGEVLASESGVPLIVDGRYDMGRVIYLAFDLKKQPIRSWVAGMEQFWREVITRPPPSREIVSDEWAVGSWGGRGRYYGPGGYGQASVADAVAQIPQMDVPSFTVVGLFLLLYVVCLVPVNYWVLKVLDRRELSWVTTPAIVLLFSLSAYGVGRSVKGGKLIVNHIGVAQTTADAHTASLDSYYGVFSPSKTDYRFKLKDPTAVVVESVSDPSAANPRRLTVTEGNTFSLRSFSVDMWSMRILHAQSNLPLGNGVEVSAVLGPGGISGRVTNGTPYTLKGCSVSHAGATKKLGELAPGASADYTIGAGRHVALTQGLLDAIDAPPDSSERTVKTTGANAVLRPEAPLTQRLDEGDVLLVAWAEGGDELGADISPGRPKTASGTLLALRAPITVAPGRFSIPLRTSSLRIISATTKEEGGLGPSNKALVATGFYVADIELPLSGWDVTFDQVKLRFTYTQGDVRVAVWDWDARRWYALQFRRGGPPQVLPAPQRFVRLPEGTVRVKVESASRTQAAHVSAIDVSATGTMH